ncbi:MAG: hypothetical protein J6S85_18755 [Methanobrevibacter sp.]|nr:hypothetical protein [Methanobrevibacter sp.]
MQKNPNKKSESEVLLDFLKKIASAEKVYETSPLNAIIAFLNEEYIVESIQQISSKLCCKYSDYTDYFWSFDDIAELVKLKDSDPEKYYTVIQYENILLNILGGLYEVKYNIVLNPEDIYKSYLLLLKTE